MSDGTITYKGYEIFSDPSFYDLIACRKEGSKSWHETEHFDTVEEAKGWVDYEQAKSGVMQ